MRAGGLWWLAVALRLLPHGLAHATLAPTCTRDPHASAHTRHPPTHPQLNSPPPRDASGMLLPNRTWTFFGEIVGDSLSQLSVLGHRVEVRDVTGSVHRCACVCGGEVGGRAGG